MVSGMKWYHRVRFWLIKKLAGRHLVAINVTGRTFEVDDDQLAYLKSCRNIILTISDERMSLMQTGHHAWPDPLMPPESWVRH